MTAEVQFDFGLITPIVGPLMAAASVEEAGDWGYPFPELTLRESVTLPMPYRRMNETGWP